MATERLVDDEQVTHHCRSRLVWSQSILYGMAVVDNVENSNCVSSLILFMSASRLANALETIHLLPVGLSEGYKEKRARDGRCRRKGNVVVSIA